MGNSGLDDFKARIATEWLEPFCTARGFDPRGFVDASVEKLTERDAEGFIYALEHGLVEHRAGHFTAPRSQAKEQIFWEGRRSVSPRPLTLWLEPIITIAGLARLHREFNWPKEQLGMQSKSWAFDLIATSLDVSRELLVVEVKKSSTEVARLLAFMCGHLNEPEIESELTGYERNAFKKVLALRNSAASVFWALGPNGHGVVFRVVRQPSGALQLEQVDEHALRFDASPVGTLAPA